jgi:hypothetical protein
MLISNPASVIELVFGKGCYGALPAMTITASSVGPESFPEEGAPVNPYTHSPLPQIARARTECDPVE